MNAVDYDLAVVGAGVLGLAHAYTAARAGLKVAVIERNPRANGASIRNFGFVTVTGQQRGDHWRMAMRTRDVWSRIAPAAGIPVHHQGLLMTARSEEAMSVLEAFMTTEMGEDCVLLSAQAVRDRCHGWGGETLRGGLWSPHERRVESRTAIPALAAWLQSAMNVTFLYETVAFDVAPPVIATSRGQVRAAAAVICPGDDFVTLGADRIAAYGLKRCRLSMLRLADPGVRLPCALMSDFGLTRYAGYAELPEAKALEQRLRVESPECFDHGVHLIVVQSGDGTLVVGDSHHYADLPDPFAPAAAEAAILDEYERALGRSPPPVTERWTGIYAVAPDRPYLIDAPSADTRIAIVTGGTGASTGFGLAEKVLSGLLNLDPGVEP